MNDMEQARQAIDDADRQIAALFEDRMKAAGRIAEYKKLNGLGIIDAKREAEVIANNSAYIKDETIKEYYPLFMKGLMKQSVSYQMRLNQGMRVAYTGVPGAFAYIAANKMFPDAEYVSYPDFSLSYDEVVKGNCDVAVLPIENSTAGDVGMVMDLIYSGDLFINRIMSIDIEQNLLGVKGATKESIRTVFSHPQALAQSSEFITRHGYEQVERVNTAVAAQEVAEKNDKTIGAIASYETASLYGLEVLEKAINTERNNSTRFACFSRVLNKNVRKKSGDGFIIVFSVANEVGSLAKALDIIGSNGFNMRNLRSRPMKSRKWKYYFYAELEGDAFGEAGSDLMIQLKTVCDEVKLAGTYAEGS
ncbi:MAG TPA: bifunctional chorismate mutase/prephenate dehydratase [Spirochaetaceae bacterium]|nr:bifunctional chorismate mutase/prephenate dehydratase [Spirochaetaceae bacterium]